MFNPTSRPPAGPWAELTSRTGRAKCAHDPSPARSESDPSYGVQILRPAGIPLARAFCCVLFAAALAACPGMEVVCPCYRPASRPHGGLPAEEPWPGGARACT